VLRSGLLARSLVRVGAVRLRDGGGVGIVVEHDRGAEGGGEADDSYGV
jgi:hypothetical protein